MFLNDSVIEILAILAVYLNCPF